MTSKQRAYLKSLAMDQSAILQIGKSSLKDRRLIHSQTL